MCSSACRTTNCDDYTILVSLSMSSTPRHNKYASILRRGERGRADGRRVSFPEKKNRRHLTAKYTIDHGPCFPHTPANTHIILTELAPVFGRNESKEMSRHEQKIPPMGHRPSGVSSPARHVPHTCYYAFRQLNPTMCALGRVRSRRQINSS